MDLSIIIPTHNRAKHLNNLLQSIKSLSSETECEVIVVDNNSTDDTKRVAQSYPDFVKYVFEKNTSFTKARRTGYENSSGDILLYIDDDIEIAAGSLKSIINIFKNYEDCGVIAGQILPKFETEPPAWCLACQQQFNSWSLYYPGLYKDLYYGFQEVAWAAGPMMAISRDIYEKTGGFPPDTIGVETNTSGRAFRKLYIGPGDYGLCHNVIKNKRKVYYSPDVRCFHIIPAIRFTLPFWRSRMIGEGHHAAITDKMFFKLSNEQVQLKRYRLQRELKDLWKILKERHIAFETTGHDFGKEIYLSELYLNYNKSYIEMSDVLNNNPDLSNVLWKIGFEGVGDNDFDSLIKSLPEDFLQITANDKVYIDGDILKNEAYCSKVEELIKLSRLNKVKNTSLRIKSGIKNRLRIQ